MKVIGYTIEPVHIPDIRPDTGEGNRRSGASADGGGAQQRDTLEENEEEVVLEEQAGVLRGALAFDIIHSDDLWRHILEFV